MVEFENKIQIHRPIQEVFSFLSDFENIPKWNYYVLSARKISGDFPGIGTTYHQVRKTDEQYLSVIEYLPDQSIAVRTLPESSPQLEMRFILQVEGEGTIVRDQWKLETGRPALLEKLAAGNIKSAVAENLGKLKELLEVGRVTLQDGRNITLQEN